jgi:[ribosomal protein S18]-alanine N-acetyltransferase
VKVRKATLADIPSMIAMDRVSATSAHWTERQYLDLFSTGRLVWLACGEESSHAASATETLLGFIVAQQIATEWQLENIVASPAARRRGIGKRLLDALVRAARETDSEAVFLEVRESNRSARSLYESAGFQHTGRRKSYYANPLEDAVLYRLNLR